MNRIGTGNKTKKERIDKKNNMKLIDTEKMKKQLGNEGKMVKC